MESDDSSPITRFIVENLRLQPVPSVEEILAYAAHSGSRLGRMPGSRENAAPPYWAYHWAGGSVLARHILTHPDIVAGRRVIDLGTGSGVVAIAAARSGAAAVTGVDTDSNAIAAARLNAAANNVDIECLNACLLRGEPPDADLILAGDVFYSRTLARVMLPFLRRCNAEGLSVLIGDPGRKTLPRSRLKQIADYPVADFGSGQGEIVSGVYTLRGRRT